MLWWALGLAATIVAGVGYLQHRAQGGVYRPHASRRPTRPDTSDKPLGFEALDMDAVHRVTRQNESLERGSTNWSRRGSWLENAANSEVAPMADDENYAKRYYAAFQKDKTKD